MLDTINVIVLTTKYEMASVESLKSFPSYAPKAAEEYYIKKIEEIELLEDDEKEYALEEGWYEVSNGKVILLVHSTE